MLGSVWLDFRYEFNMIMELMKLILDIYLAYFLNPNLYLREFRTT